jgi:hypothetical protein
MPQRNISGNALSMTGLLSFEIWCPEIAYTNISQGIKKAHSLSRLSLANLTVKTIQIFHKIQDACKHLHVHAV